MKIIHIMRFVAHGGLAPEHMTSGNRGLTGTEQTLIAFAEASANAGHRVIIYVPTPRSFLHNGVWYMDVDAEYPRLAELDGADVVVAWLSADPLQWVPDNVFRVHVLQINDWSMCSALFDSDYSHVDRFVIQSRPHRDWLWTRAGSPKDQDRAIIVPNGVWTQRYPPNPVRIPHRLISCSSPDRGLHILLHLWPEIRQAVPDASLHIFYEVKKWIQGSQHVINEVGQRARYIGDRLVRLEGHGVHLRNAVPPMTLAGELAKSDLYVFPCFTISFTEGFCHPPGTRILTQRGEKNIEHLALSDSVLTHRGRWMPIRSISKRAFSGELVQISPYGGEAVPFTPEHPILAHPPTRERGALDRGGFKWTEASRIEEGWYLYSPSLRSTDHPMTLKIPKRLISGSRGSGDHLFGSTRRAILPEVLDLTPELCRFIGYFAGDGNANKRGRPSVSIFFGINEPKEMEDCERCAISTFGVKPDKIDFSPRKKMIALRWQHSAFSFALASWCYDMQGKKVLPEWCMGLDRKLMIELLIGLWRSDGSVYFARSSGARIAAFTSSSLPLISQVRVLLGRLGYRVAIQTRSHKNGHESYSVLFSVAGAFLDYPEFHPKKSSGLRGRETSDGERALIVRRVERLPYVGDVLYIGVSGDNSYHIGNFVAHNSVSTLEACAAGTVPVITDMDALGEVYKDSGAVIVPIGNRRTAWIDTYRDRLIEMLLHGRVEGEDLTLDDRRLKCRRFAEAFDFSIIGPRFHAILEEGVRAKKEIADEEVARSAAQLEGPL